MQIFVQNCLGFFDIEFIKNSSHFPKTVIIFVHLIRYISVVTKIPKTQYVKEFVVFYSVFLKVHKTVLVWNNNLSSCLFGYDLCEK